ncbi:glutamine synthetase [Elysia marginata]|uniref:Glutamine synthetase n=1 Tax=Elysia marginata TaxID=1093978 RepID=A0AAV4HAQ4_9GAST|nr:glutamine synthetase [Elysia marginata]
MGLVQAMKDIDVRLDSLQAEFGSGQFEGTFDIADDIELLRENRDTATGQPTYLSFCRRIGFSFSPCYANWANENRESTFRVRFEAGQNVYMENRLPSSACSPHLVLACTLAAGMDGLRRNLSLPGPMDTSKKLPDSLDEALNALEADAILKESLGEKFVDMFVYSKRTFELEEFKAFGDLSEDKQILKEKEFYYELL